MLEEVVGVGNRVAGDDVKNARLECAIEGLGPAVKLIGREGKGEVWRIGGRQRKCFQSRHTQSERYPGTKLRDLLGTAASKPKRL